MCNSTGFCNIVPPRDKNEMHKKIKLTFKLIVLLLALMQCGNGNIQLKNGTPKPQSTQPAPNPDDEKLDPDEELELDDDMINAITNAFLKEKIKKLQAGEALQDTELIEPTTAMSLPVLAVYEPKYRLPLLKYLHKHHVSLHTASYYNIAPMHIAAQTKKLGALKFLIKQGANINAQDDSQRTPLMSAIEKQQIKAVRRLLQAGADPNIADRSGPPLKLALSHSNFPIIELLLANPQINLSSDAIKASLEANLKSNFLTPAQKSYIRSAVRNKGVYL
jgi:hypothetical protein